LWDMGLVVRNHVPQWEARRESRGKGARRALVRGETEGKATELRMEEVIWGRVEERPLRSRSRCPYELERERGGNLRTREAVRVGIPWINLWAMARVKVEMEGEPKER
jgi:hypothetical protein